MLPAVAAVTENQLLCGLLDFSKSKNSRLLFRLIGDLGVLTLSLVHARGNSRRYGRRRGRPCKSLKDNIKDWTVMVAHRLLSSAVHSNDVSDWPVNFFLIFCLPLRRPPDCSLWHGFRQHVMLADMAEP